MSRISVGTPCPSGSVDNSTRWPGRDDTLTTDIDYTRALRPDLLHGAKPRRKSIFVRKTERNAGITIFEDVMEDVELALEKPKAVVGATLLSKPAQKLPIEVKRREKPGALEEMRQPRASLLPSISMPTTSALAAGTLKKNPRRRTIFVPDDTTMLTIHPGANSTCLEDTFQLPVLAMVAPTPQPRPQPQPDAAVLVRSPPARRARMSMAPKRAPLRHVQVTTNVSNAWLDIPGQGGGKENVPPKETTAAKSLMKEKSGKPLVAPPAMVKSGASQSRLFEHTASSQARQTIVVRRAAPAPKPRTMAKVEGITTKSRITHAHSVSLSTASTSHQSRPRNPPAFLKTFQAPASTKLAQYPILAEDVDQPQLYGTGYLSQEEIALTELANAAFGQAEPKQWDSHNASLRLRLLDIYHRPEVTTLYNRIKASLEYGALSRPKDMPSPPDLTQDLGLRKRFLRLWLRNYEVEALQTAAEVVVGRQVRVSLSSSHTSSDVGSLDNSRTKRSLVSFLETFFVSVEDLDECKDHGKNETSDEMALRRWQKTVLRSLMLVWLLDQAKTSGAVSDQLFTIIAQHKSSTAVLHALSGLLVPSVGDITRTLRHLNYSLEHIQDPLDEVDYRISNIAVDFRDGIRLTRLVEILLFGGKNVAITSSNAMGNATMTLHLPDQTILQSDLLEESVAGTTRILSQHIKMPCLGRAQKLYNVQVALTALFEYSGFALDVTADEIVDGHREKTINLLYDFINQHLFTQLVDRHALVMDIERAGEDTISAKPSTQSEREDMLLLWATGCCSSVDTTLRIGNLTTSFADGKAYKAILASFAEVLPSPKDGSKTTLAHSLRSLGCSQAFITSLTPSTTTIPTRITTISRLALLASRLLPLAKEHHAACSIQRFVRRRLALKHLSQRVTQAKLAHACATVVQTQQRLVHAAVILQRSWRSVLAAKFAARRKDVVAFQTVARGWAVRRKVARMSRFGVGDGSGFSRNRGW